MGLFNKCLHAADLFELLSRRYWAGHHKGAKKLPLAISKRTRLPILKENRREAMGRVTKLDTSAAVQESKDTRPSHMTLRKHIANV